MRHLAQWTAPAPFWSSASDGTEASRLSMRRPALLRFASDAFMEEFNRTLETDPPKLKNLEATYETWKKPRGSSAVVAPPARAVSTPEKRLSRLRVSVERRLARLSGGTALLELGNTAADTPPPLKLYQPAHQRYYLVTAALVCRLPGMPDRAINTSNQEKASFVLRRVRASSSGLLEYGFVPSGTGGTWTPIFAPQTSFADAEERLALFAVNFSDDEGHKRRVLAGLIPAGKREVYVGSPEAHTPTPTTPLLAADLIEPGGPIFPSAAPKRDARIAQLAAEVIQPWKTLIQQADRTGQTIHHESNDGKDKTVMFRTARETIQVASWYIVLDFARFLEQHLKPVWDALPNATSAGLDGKQAKVWDALNVTLPVDVFTAFDLVSPLTVKTSLRAVLHMIHPKYGDQLEAAADRFDLTTASTEWPDFLFPLMDVTTTKVPNSFNGLSVATTPSGTGLTDMQKALRRLSALSDLIEDALPDEPNGDVPELPLAAQPVMAPDERPMFIVRCVLERPDCVEPPVFSATSEPFEIAGFFDPDAPARPIRIALPIDTSPAGLRRAPKNAVFMMSDILCGQVNRAKSMGFIDLVLSVLPWPLHKDLDGGSSACKADGDSVGMICSLSIPIITICALIILIIMVTILDMIFKWLPFLIFCFPLPKFSGKPPKTTSP